MKKTASTLEKVLTFLLCLILIPVILINTTMIVKSYLQPEKIPSVFGFSPVVVLSGSMYPAFDTNSLIFIKNVDTDTLVQGDIICYLENGTTAVTHRIHEILEEDGAVTYITKGDANNTPDRMSVSPSQVQGKYIGHVEGVGGTVMFMQSPTGMILFIALPMAVYFAVDIFLTQKEKKGEKKRTEELEAELAELRKRVGDSN